MVDSPAELPNGRQSSPHQSTSASRLHDGEDPNFSLELDGAPQVAAPGNTSCCVVAGHRFERARGTDRDRAAEEGSTARTACPSTLGATRAVAAATERLEKRQHVTPEAKTLSERGVSWSKVAKALDLGSPMDAWDHVRGLSNVLGNL